MAAIGRNNALLFYNFGFTSAPLRGRFKLGTLKQLIPNSLPPVDVFQILGYNFKKRK